MKKVLTIEGMKCEGCASTVVEKLGSIEGVERVVVDLEKKQASVESQDEIEKTAFIEALSDTNYNLAK